MSEWTGQSKGSPLGYRIFIGLINVNIKLAYLLLKPVSFFYFLFSKKAPIKYFYSQRLGYGKIKTFISIYKNYVMLGKVLVDKIAILSGQKDKYTFDFEGEEYLHQLASSKEGGLLLGAHMGNWEVAGELLERVDSVINILMLDVEHERIKDVLSDAVREKKVNIIPIKEDMSHIIGVINAFKNKELVAMHGDRFLEGVQTIDMPFLGATASFPIGAFMLAGKYNIPITYVFAAKETNTHYHFYATKPKVYALPRKPDLKEIALKEMLHDYISQVQLVVNKYPLQWFNYHPFWNDEKL